MTLRPDDVAALREKYDALLELRRARDDAEAAGHRTFTCAAALARKRRMRDVATRFPGALRELETLDRTALRERREAVDAVSNGADVPAWLRAVALLHPALRAALDERARVTRLQRRTLPRPSEHAFRLVAASLGTTPAGVERMVFPRR